MADSKPAVVKRATGETAIEVRLRLRPGKKSIATGIAFFDHMLAQIAQHGLLELAIKAKGDLDVDFHHTVEDTGIALGMALEQALGDKRGIARFADACAPLDEALARVVLDLSGRPGLYYRATFTRGNVGDFDLQLVREFFQGFANAAKATLHIDLLEGVNAHHQAEAIFKAFALALRQAIAPVAAGEVPSTKGSL